MNAFQILKKETPLSMREIDEIAAKFWGKEINPKYYATPKKRQEFEEGIKGDVQYHQQSNWYDVIGFSITQTDCSGWEEVINIMISQISSIFITPECSLVKFENTSETQMHLPDSIEERIYGALEFYRPYVELIKHFKELGLVPKKI